MTSTQVLRLMESDASAILAFGIKIQEVPRSFRDSQIWQENHEN